MEVNQFRAKLEQAFKDVLYPGDNDLTECPCPECVEIAEYFGRVNFPVMGTKNGVREH